MTTRKNDHKTVGHLNSHEMLLHAWQSSQQELEIGRKIQASFLPNELVQPPGWEISAFLQAARQVGGDFYDVFPVSGGKRVGIVIGDVCDKGVGAALFMALFRSLIRAFAEQHYSLGWMDVLSEGSTDTTPLRSVGRRRTLLSTGATALKNTINLTNNYITRNHGNTNMFATIFFGVLDPGNGNLVYINAGHVPPVMIGTDGLWKRIEPTGPAVGLFPDIEFSIGESNLRPGEILLTFTDGAADARSPQGGTFSEEQLIDLALQSVSSVDQLIENLRSGLERFIAGADQYDDITLLAVRRKPV